MPEKEDEYILRAVDTPDGKHAVVNRAITSSDGRGGGRMTPEETERMARQLRGAGAIALVIKHTCVAAPDPTLPRRGPRAREHSYTHKLLALHLTESTTVEVRHQPWCDAMNKRWNCNCDAEVVAVTPLDTTTPPPPEGTTNG